VLGADGGAGTTVSAFGEKAVEAGRSILQTLGWSGAWAETSARLMWACVVRERCCAVYISTEVFTTTNVEGPSPTEPSHWSSRTVATVASTSQG